MNKKLKLSRLSLRNFFFPLILSALIALFSSCTTGAPSSSQSSSSQTAALPQTSSAFVFSEPEGPPSTATPLLWKVSSPESDSTVYLFGSIHVADNTLYPLNPTILEAYGKSDYLAVECDITKVTESPSAMVPYAKEMIYMDGTTLSDEIGPDLFARLLNVLESNSPLKIDSDMLNRFKPAMVLSLLQNIAITKSGLSADKGVDLYFLGKAKTDGTPILEIESIDAQMKLLLHFPPEIQNMLLESSINVEEAAQGTNLLYELWKKGDLSSFEAYALQSEEKTADDPALAAAAAQYEKEMLTDRNVLMANTADAYCKEGKNVFFTVGAMHMVGEDGIVKLLEQKGYTVEQIHY